MTFLLSDREMIITALQCRRCIIETGDYALTAENAIKSGHPEMVKALSTDQMKVIIRTEELINGLLGER